MRAIRLVPASIFSLIALAAGCHRAATAVYVTVERANAEPVLAAYEKQRPVRAVYGSEEADGAAPLDPAVVDRRRRPDVVWAHDPVFALRLLRQGLVERYAPRDARRLYQPFVSAEHDFTPVSAWARVILVNRDRLAAEGGGEIRSVRDLASPRFRGRAVLADPRGGGSQLHVAALFAAWGEERAREFLHALDENHARVVGGDAEVAKLVASGEATLGLCGTEQAAAALASGAPVDVVYPDQSTVGTLVLPTVAMVVRGAPHPTDARRLIDWLITPAAIARLTASGAWLPAEIGGGAPPRGLRSLREIRRLEVPYSTLLDAVGRTRPVIDQWLSARAAAPPDALPPAPADAGVTDGRTPPG